MKTILVDAANTFVIKGHGIFQEMYSLLETYKNKKIILANADEEQIIALGLDKMPYEVFTLMHNPEKKDPEYFKTLISKYSLEIKNVIYFEHNQAAIESARSLGIKSFYYDQEKKDLDSLKVFLDQNAY
jgi:HAD superfamily hydrolase (TIGR01509 family)